MTQAKQVGRPRVIVAGGSLGGLAAGLELLSAGCDVSVFERSGRVLDDRGAGIVMQAETFHLLRKYHLADEHTAGVWSRFRQYLDRDGVGQPTPSQQLMTSWGLLYGKLRSAFPAERYHEDRAVTGFEVVADGGRNSAITAFASSLKFIQYFTPPSVVKSGGNPRFSHKVLAIFSTSSGRMAGGFPFEPLSLMLPSSAEVSPPVVLAGGSHSG
jgi:hypothetical protein